MWDQSVPGNCQEISGQRLIDRRGDQLNLDQSGLGKPLLAPVPTKPEGLHLERPLSITHAMPECGRPTGVGRVSWARKFGGQGLRQAQGSYKNWVQPQVNFIHAFPSAWTIQCDKLPEFHHQPYLKPM